MIYRYPNGFAATADANVSFDGKSVLFSARFDGQRPRVYRWPRRPFGAAAARQCAS